MNIFSSISILPVFKIFFLLGLFIYVVFSLVVVKQISTMNKTLDVGFETQIAALGYIHLIFAISVFLTAFVIL